MSGYSCVFKVEISVCKKHLLGWPDCAGEAKVLSQSLRRVKFNYCECFDVIFSFYFGGQRYKIEKFPIQRYKALVIPCCIGPVVFPFFTYPLALLIELELLKIFCIVSRLRFSPNLVLHGMCLGSSLKLYYLIFQSRCTSYLDFSL